MPRPEVGPSAVAAQGGFGPARTPGASFAEELNWSFRHPRPWLEGLAVNLVLSVLYLVWEPLTGRHRAAWVILVGSYFATFVLADVTTTNILGPDRIRLRRTLARGVGIHTVILRKNFILLLVVGLPTLTVAAVLSLSSHDGHRLAFTLSGVAFPILTWLGVGNLVSVLLPVAYVPWRLRWRLRHKLGWNARWAAHLALPYALLYAVEPVDDLPLHLLRHVRTVSMRDRPDLRGALIAAGGVAIWLSCTWAATLIVQRRGLAIR